MGRRVIKRNGTECGSARCLQVRQKGKRKAFPSGTRCSISHAVLHLAAGREALKGNHTVRLKEV